MPISAVVRLAVAVGILVLPGREVSACGLWLCGDSYPPMRVPAHDPRVGPTWTRNGWVDLPGYAPPMPYADPGHGLKDFDRPRAPWPTERSRRWRR